MKNLYLVKRNKRIGWEEYDSFVVCSKIKKTQYKLEKKQK